MIRSISNTHSLSEVREGEKACETKRAKELIADLGWNPRGKVNEMNDPCSLINLSEIEGQLREQEVVSIVKTEYLYLSRTYSRSKCSFGSAKKWPETEENRKIRKEGYRQMPRRRRKKQRS